LIVNVHEIYYRFVHEYVHESRMESLISKHSIRFSLWRK